MTIAHTGIKVSPELLAATVTFYETTLAPLGYKKALSLFHDTVVGFADANGVTDWWVSAGEAGGKVHTAFRADDRATVDKFHAAALQAGGKDNGQPGLREWSGPHYYGAYVFDPAGNNIEAVCEKPVEQ
ncbi:Glyoxalase/Bleomycin resistance protein/Dihydroxybiphenyl dioxygenase [Podospora australis]|uniref:Glyoxalase/Bleomycin resistance protein/Dihydroxybiphenyl dioxygenase n=1 Tax=Podospora australis TaxID=1536484 RepID=A0AAN6WJI2_9PEZI|nr:Glyoxalase/Bleomycin resistance protein/Dihydroxybiphenyl dioxygenase [Podospora australis]